MKLTPQYRLALFIVLSLAIHTALLRIDNSLVEITQHKQGGSQLQFELQPKDTDVDSDILTDEKITEKRTAKTQQKLVTVEDSFATPQETTSQNNQPAQASITARTGSLETENNTPVIQELDVVKVNRIIADKFTHNFYYPTTARRRNWQGDVVLQFTLMPDGSIVHIRINKSSGYRVLDEAAMDVMSKIKAEQQLALVLNGNSLNQLLPVSYQLQDAL